MPAPLRGIGAADEESRKRDGVPDRLMSTVTLRLVASPPLAEAQLESARAASSSLLASVSDRDVNATLLSFSAGEGEVGALAQEIATRLGPSAATGRAFRLELQSEDPNFPGDDLLRAIAVDVHGILRCPTYIARRTVPVSAWTSLRPMGWGPAGLAVGAVAPSLPYGGSESHGLAIETGAATIIVKVSLVGAPLSSAHLALVTSAVGGPGSGFLDLGAYAIGARPDGSHVLVLELGDVRRTPLHRVLEVIEIEARRMGARLGLGALLTQAPLETFTGALAMHMGLSVARDQVIETHLPAPVQAS